MSMRPARVPLALLGAALIAGCDLAPVYDRPHFLLPDTYQGGGPLEFDEAKRRAETWLARGSDASEANAGI